MCRSDGTRGPLRHDDHMDDPIEILRRAERVVLYDWPDRHVPDALALAGLDVIVHGGSAPDDVFRSEVSDC